MINKINKVIKFFKTLITATLGVTSLYIIEKLSNILGEAGSIILLILVVVIFTMFFEEILISLVKNSQSLRRFISGAHYIEGVWVDKTIDIHNSSRLVTASVFRIFFENNEMKYNGEIFNQKGETIGTFRSTSTRYNDDYVLFSSYNAKILHQDSAENELSGFAEYTFVEGEKYPLSFHGYAIDNLEGEKRVIQAVKIEDKKTLSKINNIEFKKEFILNMIQS